MVPAANGSKLVAGRFLQRPNRLELPGHVGEQLVIHPDTVFLADAKGQVLENRIHDPADVPAHVRRLGIG